MSSPVFDYVIVGGGNAGLVVASRLVEQLDVTVCVLEAGQDFRDEANIQVPCIFFASILVLHILTANHLRGYYEEPEERPRLGIYDRSSAQCK